MDTFLTNFIWSYCPRDVSLSIRIHDCLSDLYEIAVELNALPDEFENGKDQNHHERVFLVSAIDLEICFVNVLKLGVLAHHIKATGTKWQPLWPKPFFRALQIFIPII